jgi:hypothetical protein
MCFGECCATGELCCTGGCTPVTETTPAECRGAEFCLEESGGITDECCPFSDTVASCIPDENQHCCVFVSDNPEEGRAIFCCPDGCSCEVCASQSDPNCQPSA